MTTSVSNATEASAPSGFAALNLSEPVMRAIDEVGYTEPTPVQAATYPIAITGRDLIVQARTGTGKTAAFGIPLVDKLVTADPWVQALVLAPTRELAVQSQREIARLAQFKGLHTVAIYGGAPMGRQIDELKSGAQIVSGTPGRVLDHLRRGTLEPGRLKVLVLDEMDEMLSMGFAKELNAILEMLPAKGRRQTMCFSATVDGEIRRHAERHMHEPEMISLSSDAVSAAQITHHVYMVSGRDRISDLVRVLEVEDPDSAIVFCNMRSETERVAMGLKQAGFNADWLNGDLAQKDRERIMSSTREGKLRYLVATDVAARGIDISHLTHVINFTFPESAAVYVHRTGRTGRAGRTGCAISLVGPEELGRLYYLRLEYKISPVERSLPTHGELKTRQEVDRIGLLEAAFTNRANPNDLSVARRLLTHPENERILAGLLQTFFGTKEDVDDEAAAARRSKPGPDVDQAERATRERERFTGGGRAREDRPRSRDRDRDRGRDSARPPRDGDREARISDGPRDGRDRTRDRDGSREARSGEGVRERDARSGEGTRDRDGSREARSGEGARDRDGSREARSGEGSRGGEGARERDGSAEARAGEGARGEGSRDARERDGSRGRDRDRDGSRRPRERNADGARDGAEGTREARDGGEGARGEGDRDGSRRPRERNADGSLEAARDGGQGAREARDGGEARAREGSRGARDRESAPGAGDRNGDGPRNGGEASPNRESVGASGSESSEASTEARDRDRNRGPGRDRDRDAAREPRARGAGNREAGREPRAVNQDAARDRGEPGGDRSDARQRRDRGDELGSERAEAGSGEPGARSEAEAAREGRSRDRSRGRGRDERAPRVRDASGAQGELKSSDDEDTLLSASEARAPSGEESAERTRSRDRSQVRPVRAVDGELFAGSADGEAASDEASAAKPEDGAAPAGRRRRKRSRDRGRERSADGSQPTAAGDDDAQLLASGDERDISAEAPRSSERSQRSRQRAGADAKPLVAVDGALVPAEANGAEEHEPSEPTEPLEGLLYLNLGKRDGLRVPEVARLLRDSCELSRGQIGRIRVRDRYTFVDVPEGRLEGIITTLSGQLLHDKPLAPERAKTAKS